MQKNEYEEVVIETTISQEYDEILEETGIDESKIKQQIHKLYDKAKKIINDKEKVLSLLEKAEKLCSKLSRIPLIGNQFDDISALCSMIRDYITKVYTKVPLTTVITLLAAVLYFLNPTDLIWDAIPLIGYADDMLVFSFVTEAAKKDIKAYKKWKKEQEKLSA